MVSNTVPCWPTQRLHDEAVKLLKAEKVAKNDVKTYDQRRKDATEKLKPALTAIQDKFKVGKTVGGESTIKDWCKRYGGITYRRFHQIVRGESQTKKKGEVKSLHLREGMTITIGKQKIVLTAAHLAFILKYAPKKQTKAEWKKEFEAKKLEEDLALLEKWGKTHVGDAQTALYDCSDRLNLKTRQHVQRCLDILAETGRIPVKEVKGVKLIGQYTAAAAECRVLGVDEDGKTLWIPNPKASSLPR